MASFDRSAILEIEETTRDHNRHDRSDVMHEVYSATAEELVDANGVEIRALSRLGEAPAADGSAVAVCALRGARARASPGVFGWAMARDERFVGAALLGPGDEAACVVAEYAGRVGLWRGRAAQKLAHGIWEKTMKRARQAVSADAKASRVLGDAVGRELQRLGRGGASAAAASAGPWCGGCGVELGAGPPNWVRVCGGRGCGALVCEGCCDQGGFFRKAAEAKARCQGCRARARGARSSTAGRPRTRGASRSRASAAPSRPWTPPAQAGSAATSSQAPARSRDKWGGDGDDDDPALGDAFAAADRDGDGFVDLQDVVEWLSSAAQSQEKKNDRATLALAKRRSDDSSASGVEDDRGAFAAWPLSEASATVGAVETFLLKLAKGRLAFHEARDRDPVRVLVLHPAVVDVARVDEKAVKLELTLEEQTETLTVAFGTEDACGEWWAAVSETLAIHRRLRGPKPAAADVPVVLFDEVGDDGDFEDTPAAGSKKHRRRSVRFSDADEVEVSRGFAFDRVVKQDGSVKWEVSTPRRAKSAWRTVVRLVIRPPRASYDVGELGPLSFEIPSLRDAQKKLACVRSDFTVVNDDGLKLACSLWSSVLGAGDFDDRATWRRPGKASTEKRPKAFEKPCVLYLHGNASCRLECLPHVAPLLMLGLRVCAVDTSGSGLSEGEFVTLGEREAKDAACVAAHLVAAKRASAAGFFAGLSARGALAESAAKAAIDAVTAEVKKRAALDVASVDASLAVAALDAPLLLVAANGDQLIPPRPNAGALLKLYANAKTGPKKSQRQRDAELLLVKGGHNSRRPHSCARKTYEFLAKHLSAPGTDDAELDAAAAKLDAYRPKIAGGHAPWTYCAQALKAPTKDRGGEFRSGMTDAREKAIARDMSSVTAAEAPLPPPRAASLSF
ncbi:palmitoyl-(protein) hydrolase [Aureococcus anophagefferens]|nr:palmitoyl-(protein) hydrolase [Aureococcus anophagefferens]